MVSDEPQDRQLGRRDEAIAFHASERVLLRELRLEDWPAIHSYSQLPEVCRYQAWGPNTPQQTRAFVETTITAATETPRVTHGFAAIDPTSNRVIGMGTVGFSNAVMAIR